MKPRNYTEAQLSTLHQSEVTAACNINATETNKQGRYPLSVLGLVE
jgi:hypothetical protein